MHLRGPSKALLLACLISLMSLAVGCGGSGDQSGGQQEDASDGAEQQGGEANNNDAPEVRIALGKIGSVNPEDRKIVLLPSTEEQGERKTFMVVEKARVTLDGEEVELADIKEGQQAQVSYVVRNERNRARTVELFSDGDTAPGGGEATG
jgi:hypothetical protein